MAKVDVVPAFRCAAHNLLCLPKLIANRTRQGLEQRPDSTPATNPHTRNLRESGKPSLNRNYAVTIAASFATICDGRHRSSMLDSDKTEGDITPSPAFENG